MSQPLLATARLKLEYTVNSLQHVFHAFCAYNLVIGVPQLVDRDGITTVLWSLAGQFMWDAIRHLWSATDVPAVPNWTLENISAGIYTPVISTVLTGIGSGGAAAPASEWTMVMRDTAFKKLRIVFLEHNVGYLGHGNAPHGVGGGLNACEDIWTGANADPSAPYRWQKSRGNRFIAGTGNFAGSTLDLNDKIKRARHME